MISYGIKGQPKLSKRLTELDALTQEIYDMGLVDFLCDKIPKLGMTVACGLLGVAPSYMNRWLLVLGLRKQVVILKPGEFVEVKNGD